jgi:RNA polymerase sigma factor (sigma-70 family)
LIPSSDENSFAPERLSNLKTSWTQIHSAHIPGPEGEVAMQELIMRYYDAVQRYLKIKIKDPNLADDVLQEFWTKVLNHKLAGADEKKGRFRDYLRTILHRLIVDHFRARKTTSLPPGDLPEPEQPDVDYDQVWREVLIKRVWAKLELYESTTANNRYATILKLRVKEPDASIQELVDKLNKDSSQHYTAEAFRKTLQRARVKFFDFLVQELRETMVNATPEDIESELNDLGLGSLYRRLK